MKTVSLVILVQDGFNSLKSCLDSITNHTDQKIVSVSVVDDASKDQRVFDLLKEFRKSWKGRVKIVRHKRRLDYLKSVEEVFRFLERENNDVIILSGDVVVSDNWLLKLRDAAYFNERNWVVTPLINKGAKFSWPRKIPRELGVKEIAEIVDAVSLREYPRIPGGLDFALYIKKDFLSFLKKLKKKGEGFQEENIFLLALKNCKHVLADDVFVYRTGEMAWRDLRPAEELRMTNVDEGLKNVLERLDFFLTRKISRERKRILYLLHNPISRNAVGGTEFHVMDLVNGLRDKYCIYVVNVEKDHVRVEEIADCYFNVYFFPFKRKGKPVVYDALLKKVFSLTLNIFSPHIVHVHHLMRASADIIGCAKTRGIPVVFSVHDGYVFCPNYSLTYRNNYCGLPDNHEICKDCLKSLGFNHLSLEEWRNSMLRELRKCDLIVFPSNTVKKLFYRIYGSMNHKIIQHGVHLPPGKVVPKEKFSVCFLGYAEPAKGEELIRLLVPLLLKENIDVHFLGMNWEKLFPEEFRERNSDKLHFHGRYNRLDLHNILSEIRPTIICLLSRGFESFGYALSEAWASGLPVVVSPHTAMDESVERSGGGLILEKKRP